MKSYLDIMRDILENGEEHDDESGTGTLSTFGQTISHDMREGFPLLTTKKVTIKGAFDELKWFLSGSTNINDLPGYLHKWWSPWADAERNLGPIYGESLRNLQDINTRERSLSSGLRVGFDQLMHVLDMISSRPSSRRIIMTTWNPSVTKLMGLPPCHGLVSHFKVHESTGEMSLSTYQRSADWQKGVPINLASYGLLLSLVAYATGYTPRKLYYTFGDAHIYKDQINQCELQLQEPCLKLPTVKIKAPILNTPLQTITKAKWEDIEVIDYVNSGKTFNTPMAINKEKY